MAPPRSMRERMTDHAVEIRRAAIRCKKADEDVALHRWKEEACAVFEKDAENKTNDMFAAIEAAAVGRVWTTGGAAVIAGDINTEESRESMKAFMSETLGNLIAQQIKDCKIPVGTTPAELKTALDRAAALAHGAVSPDPLIKAMRDVLDEVDDRIAPKFQELIGNDIAVFDATNPLHYNINNGNDVPPGLKAALHDMILHSATEALENEESLLVEFKEHYDSKESLAIAHLKTQETTLWTAAGVGAGGGALTGALATARGAGAPPVPPAGGFSIPDEACKHFLVAQLAVAQHELKEFYEDAADVKSLNTSRPAPERKLSEDKIHRAADALEFKSVQEETDKTMTFLANAAAVRAAIDYAVTVGAGNAYAGMNANPLQGCGPGGAHPISAKISLAAGAAFAEAGLITSGAATAEQKAAVAATVAEAIRVAEAAGRTISDTCALAIGRAAGQAVVHYNTTGAHGNPAVNLNAMVAAAADAANSMIAATAPPADADKVATSREAIIAARNAGKRAGQLVVTAATAAALPMATPGAGLQSQLYEAFTAAHARVLIAPPGGGGMSPAPIPPDANVINPLKTAARTYIDTARPNADDEEKHLKDHAIEMKKEARVEMLSRTHGVHFVGKIGDYKDKRDSAMVINVRREALPNITEGKLAVVYDVESIGTRRTSEGEIKMGPTSISLTYVPSKKPGGGLEEAKAYVIALMKAHEESGKTKPLVLNIKSYPKDGPRHLYNLECAAAELGVRVKKSKDVEDRYVKERYKIMGGGIPLVGHAVSAAYRKYKGVRSEIKTIESKAEHKARDIETKEEAEVKSHRPR